ncbi:hypothetical protein DM860_006226 [Cuscuta australis]|uniref:Uncharacterized protein n=1 Tax=Cuscuta australis TaxID=267555 RepID=A0A328DJZ2_9ASTE|nr:hypothetical protein DM860_006226 [Cuscuta australis]
MSNREEQQKTPNKHRIAAWLIRSSSTGNLSIAEKSNAGNLSSGLEKAAMVAMPGCEMLTTREMDMESDSHFLVQRFAENFRPALFLWAISRRRPVPLPFAADLFPVPHPTLRRPVPSPAGQLPYPLPSTCSQSLTPPFAGLFSPANYHSPSTSP